MRKSFNTDTLVKKNGKRAAGVALALTMAVAGAVPAIPLAASAAAPSFEPVAATEKFASAYTSFTEVIEAGKAKNLEIAAEGFVLMKNKAGVPPLTASKDSQGNYLKKGGSKVTVLGTAANNIAYGGGGSGAQGHPGVTNNVEDPAYIAAGEKTTIFDGLEAVGIEVNPRIKERYTKVPSNVIRIDGSFSSNSIEGGKYMEKKAAAETGSVSFAGNHYVSINNGSLSGAEGLNSNYDDAAIVVISRSGAEGMDNPSNNVGGHADKSEHYLELDDAEKELFAYAKKNFDKIIVLLNSPSVVEMGPIMEDDQIDTVLWIGQPGWNGTMEIGKVLVGDVNPSGRTVDFWMSDFTSDPVWYNSNNYTQLCKDYALTVDGRAVVQSGGHTVRMGYADDNTVFTSDADFKGDGKKAGQEALDYAEGIYMGYRYYETVYDMIKADAKGGVTVANEWWSDNVCYPFGYGLSYTTFTYGQPTFTVDAAKTKITASIVVTNSGSKAGKEVVQVYSNPPYTAGKIQKATANLVGFKKTGVINAGASETVNIEIPLKELADFDYNNANGDADGHVGYELEAGKYLLSCRKNSHELMGDAVELTLEKQYFDEADNATTKTPNNIFSQTSGKWERYNTLAYHWTESGENHYLTREKMLDVSGETATANVAELKKLAWLLDEDENKFNDAAFNILERRDENKVDRDFDDVMTADKVEDNYDNLWVKKSTDLTGVEQGKKLATPLKLIDMRGKAYNDDAWKDFLNQLTWKELVDAISMGSFSNPAVASIEKPNILDNDGPGQLKGRGTNKNGWAWACAVVVASTWNTDLAREQGRITGEESKWIGVNGWYGPGLNTHRSPLAGRNFEYYSQDGFQGGKIAAAVVGGAVNQGAHVYMKHAFMNDQEAQRLNTVTFATEQAIRQIYAKVFELAVREGDANGMMISFNLVGLESTASYAITTQLYTNEWGFSGYMVTDMWGGSKSYARDSGWSGYSLARAYCAPLGNALTSNSGDYVVPGEWKENKVYVGDKESPTTWWWVRETAKRLFYVTANGNGIMNGLAGAFADKTLKFDTDYAGSGVQKKELVSKADLEKALGTSVVSVTADKALPAGLSIDAKECAIVGTPTVIGSFDINVTIASDLNFGYVNITRKITIQAGEPASYSGKVDFKTGTADASRKLKLGEAYSAKVSSNITNITLNPNLAATDDTVGQYKDLTYVAEGLPEGLKIDKVSGEISGVPTAKGSYVVKLIARYQKVNAGRSGAAFANEDYSRLVQLTVDGGYFVTFDDNYTGGAKQTKGYAEGQQATDILAGIATPVRLGYQFLGWSAEKDSNVVVDFAAEQTSAAKTYYAIWSEQGAAPVITISEDGYLVVNGVKTATQVKSSALSGAEITGIVLGSIGLAIGLAAAGAVAVLFLGKKKN